VSPQQARSIGDPRFGRPIRFRSTAIAFPYCGILAVWVPGGGRSITQGRPHRLAPAASSSIPLRAHK
jgi:hypothetical protein